MMASACLASIALAISIQVQPSDALPIALISSNSALKVVQNMASVVAAPPQSQSLTSPVVEPVEVPKLDGLGGPVMANGKQDVRLSIPTTSPGLAAIMPQGVNPKEQVWTALSKLESNSEFLL